MKTNPNMMRTLKASRFYPTLFTNTALDIDTNEPWWEGLDGPIPKNLLDWQGRVWNTSLNSTAAHPNSRFTVSIYNTPVLSKEFDNPKGVPISAIIFGSRRSHLAPLVLESFDWNHGVFLGSSMGTETTAAATHQVGTIRRDPMAMIPFCGYNMGDYFGHWLGMKERLPNPPKIFTVNWFRVDDEGRFIWPGFGDNIRVLKWIIDRVNNRVNAKETPIGLVPYLKDIDLEGLNIPEERLEKLFEVNREEWKIETAEIKKFYERFGTRLPEEILDEYKSLIDRL
jgi:phosphoenolpyruvate carboxykinase (GTP)